MGSTGGKQLLQGDYMSFNINITGLEATLARLKKAGQDVEKEVDLEIQASGKKVELEASKRVRVDDGFLKSSISSYKAGNLRVEIVAQKKYAPYVEFGTGGLVDIPKGMESYAAQFKGKGIRKVNLPARPFMFPALMTEKPLMIERIKKLLKKKR